MAGSTAGAPAIEGQKLARGMHRNCGMDPNILVAYDFGRASEAALAWAADLQSSLRGPPLHIIHVVNPVPAGSLDLPTNSPSEPELAAIRTKLSDLIASRRIQATAEVVLDPFVAGAILKKAKDLGTNLIVMGTHGRSVLGRAFLGGVASHVVQRAPSPVVTVHSPESATRSHAA